LSEEISEQLHTEVKASVLQYVRLKCANRHCERQAERTPVITASMPAQPLQGRKASAAMIATVTAGKYVDGTPLNRMAHALARADIEVARGMLANWIIRPAGLHCSRLYEALHATLLSQHLVQANETTVKVLKEPWQAAQSTSYMWVYRSADDSLKPVVPFDYQAGRAKDYPKTFISCYKGLRITDGHTAWRMLEGRMHFGCMTHARYTFVEALKSIKKPGGRAAKPLVYFKALYQVGNTGKGRSSRGRDPNRQHVPCCVSSIACRCSSHCENGTMNRRHGPCFNACSAQRSLIRTTSGRISAAM
jgi:transposase